MEIHLNQVGDKRTLRQYIYLPRQLYKTISTWVPPIYSEEWKFHDPKYNAALAYSDVVRVVACVDGKHVGRIMGIINNKYNQQRREKTARFFNLDCGNDGRVSHALLTFIEHWAVARGMDKLIGPFGFSDKDPQGLQIEGFDHLAVIAAPSNPPYLEGLLEKEGYGKELDCVSYKLPIPQKLPPVYEKVYQRVINKHKLEVVEFTRKSQVKPYIVPALRLVNEAYAPLFGFVAMSEAEMTRLTTQYMPILDPAFMKLTGNQRGVMVGFIIALPDISRGIQKAKGRLWPFGVFHILAARRKSRQLDVVLGAIRQEYRGIGVDVVLAKALIDTARARGFQFMDSHLVLETNTRMRAEYENLGGIIYKRYRVFSKSLEPC